MRRSRPYDEAMAEMYRSDPGLVVELIQNIVADGDQAELLSVLRPMAGTSAGVERSQIIESLRGELAALHRAGAVSSETVLAFEALLLSDRGGDRPVPP